MERTVLGTTGLAVSRLGFGAFKIGRNQKIKYEQGYELPDEATVARLLNAILDLGINYIDTAPAYGLSEERIGRAIAHRRDEFVISTKVGERFEDGTSYYEFDRSSVESSLANSLQKLRTDVLDIVFIHAPADDVRVLTDTPVVEVLQQQKAAGRIRAIGFSGKTVEAAQLSLAWADVLMVEYHLNDTSHRPIIEQAAQRGIGVVVKKGLAAGRLSPEEAIPFVLNTPGVNSLVIGGLNLAHIEANLRLVPAAASSEALRR